MPCAVPTKHANRIAARPTLEKGGFFITVLSQNADPVDLVDHQKFVDFFHQTTGRKAIQFKKIIALTYWK